MTARRLLLPPRAVRSDAVQGVNGAPRVNGTPRAAADARAVQAEALLDLLASCIRHDPGWRDWPDRDRLVISSRAAEWLHAALPAGRRPAPDVLPPPETPAGESPFLPAPLRTAAEELPEPPGQILGEAVGLALAGRLLAARFGTDASPLVEHRTICLVTTADLASPVAEETASVAAALRLTDLVVLAVDSPSPLRAARSGVTHGRPPAFVAVRDGTGSLRRLTAGPRATSREWHRRFGRWATAHPHAAEEWRRVHDSRVPDGVPTRLCGQRMADSTHAAATDGLASLVHDLPELAGGHADRTCHEDAPPGDAAAPGGRVIDVAAREYALGAICNGLALHGGMRTFGTAFLLFGDRLEPSIRRAAALGLPVTYVLQRDAMAAGEDVPAGQPEHLAALRSVPGLATVRPADANETTAALALGLTRTGPTALVVGRQEAPTLPTPPPGDLGTDGAWIVRDATPRPDVVLVAAGPEVTLALRAAEALSRDGVGTRVVSMPWRERITQLDEERVAALLPPEVPRVALEATSRQRWEQLTGSTGRVVDLDRLAGAGLVGRPRHFADAIVEIVRATAHDAVAGSLWM